MIKKVLIVILALIIAVFLFFLSIYYKEKDYENKMRKVTHIDIYFGNNIEKLNKIKLTICDSIYYYSRNEILDTICENISISDRKFPCSVDIKYFFRNGLNREIQIDSFDCAGCSGINIYRLFDNKVEYIYHP